MAIKGREDLYNYTYLTANGYLNKFRNALNMPYLQIPRLAALLKEFNNRRQLKGFIVNNSQGKPCLYYKQTLNRILGIYNDGFAHTAPEQNPNLQMLQDIEEEWERKEYEKEMAAQQEYEPIDYSSDEEDMKKASDKLIYDDNYGEVAESKKKIVKNDKGETVPETCPDCGGKIGVYIQGEPVYLCSKCKKYFGTMPFNIDESFDVKKAIKKLMKRRDPGGIERKKKKIYITESQLNNIKKYISEQYFVETEKVKIVKDFLDKNFIRGAVPSVGEDGYGKAVPIVAMKIPYSDKPKNMTAAQAFYLLQDKFNKIYSESKQRDSFLKKVLVDWYYKRITKDGLLSKNNY